MANKDDILIHNLRDALQQAQRYILWGILCSLLALLLSIDAPQLTVSGGKVDLPHVGTINPGSAAMILMVAYFVLGLLANSAISQIRKIITMIDKEFIAHYTLTYLSVVTISNGFIRLGAILLPPVLLVATLVVEYVRGADLTPWSIVGILVFASPYIFLAYRLKKPIAG